MQNSLESTLASLVAIPSVSSNAEACHMALGFIEERLRPHTFFMTRETNTPNPWLIATTKDTKEPDILLACHLDVLPGEPELFTMQKQEGILRGRGVYDMKLAAACYLEFIKNHSKKLSDMNIGFLFTTDEESGGDCMTPILESGWRPKIVFLPDGGDNWQIEKRAKGLYGIELSAKGKNAHGSRPWEGENALHRLMDAVAVLRQSFPSHDPDDSTLAINELHAGTAINQIADYATAKIDFRSFSKEDLLLYRAQLDQLCMRYDLELNVLHYGSPVLFDMDLEPAQSFLKAVKAETGKEFGFCESYGASDARHFAEYDIPCLVVEPSGGGRHSPDEWLLAEDLTTYYRVIERWLLG